MKKIKNMISIAGLLIVLACGAVSANAGMLYDDDTADTSKVSCTYKNRGFLQSLADAINGLTGVTIFDVKPAGCADVNAERARWS